MATAFLMAVMFGLTTSWGILLAWVGFAFALVPLTRLMIADRRSVLAEADAVVLLDTSGREVSRILLSRPFELQYLSRGYGEAAYKLTQGDAVLIFTSCSRGADHVVRDLLQLEWPPEAPWRYGKARD